MESWFKSKESKQTYRWVLKSQPLLSSRVPSRLLYFLTRGWQCQTYDFMTPNYSCWLKQSFDSEVLAHNSTFSHEQVSFHPSMLSWPLLLSFSQKVRLVIIIFCPVRVQNRIHQNHNNGEMAEVDARNKGDSPVKTHFVILNSLPVKSKSKVTEKIGVPGGFTWSCSIYIDLNKLVQGTCSDCSTLNFTFSSSLLQCRAIAAISVQTPSNWLRQGYH